MSQQRASHSDSWLTPAKCLLLLLLISVAGNVGLLKKRRNVDLLEKEQSTKGSPSDVKGNKIFGCRNASESNSSPSLTVDTKAIQKVSPSTKLNKRSSDSSSATSALEKKNTYAMQFSLSELTTRGHFMSSWSVCDMVRWFVGSYEQGKQANGNGKCLRSLRKGDRTLTDARDLSDYDTIFVADYARDIFIKTILPDLNNDVIIITRHPVNFDPKKTEKILNHPRVLHMFSISPWRSHPKLSGFPLGLLAVKVNEYAKEFQRTMSKDAGVFVSYLKIDEKKPDRLGIPRATEPLSYKDYLQEMHRHKYVLSPNGDHPDCYRHWEAIGLGTVPITMLQRDQYEFISPAPVVFDRPLPWNVTDMELTLPRKISTNRRMVFEEYWYEYMEATVGVPLNWSPSSFWHGSGLDSVRRNCA